MQMACCPHVSTLIRFVSSKMTDDWFETMDQGLYTGVIFLDLRKAFDVVNLDLLVTKLQMYGCSSSALLWLKSYLPDRRQCVNITGTLSDTEVLRSAVPQGSVLGPVLFLLFINDLPVLRSLRSMLRSRSKSDRSILWSDRSIVLV